MANEEYLSDYDRLADIMFNPELSEDERRQQRHEFRSHFITDNSFRAYGALLLAVARDRSDLLKFDQELARIQYGD